MSLIRLTIDRISYSQNTNGAYALLLSEKDGERKLPVVIGAFEAQSIAVALEKEIKPPRPLTHDLFKNFSDCFEIKIKQVIIHKIIDGVFFSSLICVRDKIEEIIDARTSDAIALSLRFSSPIFVNKKVLDEAGFEDDERYSEEIKLTDDSFFETYKTDTSDENITKSKDLKKISTNKIKKMLEKSIQNEDYIIAAKLRDELNIRKSIK